MLPLSDNKIGETIKDFRKIYRLTKEKLADLSQISVKTLRKLEKGERTIAPKTLHKIKIALKKNFDLDLSEKTKIRIVWEFEDLEPITAEIIEGSLLGDGCISQYGIYQQEAKDEKYLKWLGELLGKSGIRYKITHTKSRTSYSKEAVYYRLYTHSCPAFFELRKIWYIKNNKEKEIKRVPRNIKLTPTALLHWYLGDGNLKRDKRPGKKGGRPSVRLFTNDFSKEDIKLLIKNLKRDLDLNFYPSPKLNKNIKKGCVLYLYTKDLFKFFNIIGQKPPVEIENSITKEFEEGKFCTFKEKWPNESDWIKILAKTKGIGALLKEKRKKLGLTQRIIAEEVGITKHHIAEIEAGRKNMSLSCFNRILALLKLDVNKLLNTLFTSN